MAINFATDQDAGRVAILMNQAFFNFAAPNAVQLEAQIDYFQFYNFGDPTNATGTINLIQATLNFPQLLNLTAAQFAEQVWNNVYGAGTATPEIVSFLVNAYAGDKFIIATNIILQKANEPDAKAEALDFLLKAQAGTAVFNEPLFLPPSDIKIDGSAADTILENSPQGTIVGAITVDDADTTEAGKHTLEIVSTSLPGAFVLSGNNLIVQDPALLNREAIPGGIVTVNVKATDPQDRSFTKLLIINVTDSGPDNATLSATAVSEEQAIGTVVGSLAAVDTESNGPYTFEILPGGDAAKFSIDGNQLKTAAKFDFEDPALDGPFSITVRVTDVNGEFKDVGFTVTVTDIPDAVEGQPFSLTINTDSIVGTDGDDTVSGTSASPAQPSATTANAGDNIDGGLGTDTFILQIDGPNPNPVDGITLNNVEEVEVINNSPFSAQVVASQFNGVNQFTVRNSQGNLQIQDIQFVAGLAVTIQDQNTDVALDFDGSTTVPSDLLTITVDEVGTPGQVTDVDIDITEDDFLGPAQPGNFSTVALNSVGGIPNFIDEFRAGNIQTLDINGNTDLTLGDENDGATDLVGDNALLSTIDASGLNANLTVELDDDDGADAGRNVTYTGAQGDDRVQMGDLLSDGLNGGQIFNGGGGNNRLVFNEFDDIGAGNGLEGLITNFQTAEFQQEVGDAGETILNADQLDGVRTFIFSDGVDDGGTVDVRGLDPNQTHTFVIAEDNSATTDVNMDFNVGDPPNTAADGTADRIVLDVNDDDILIRLSGDEIEQFVYQRIANGDNTVTLQEAMTDMELFQVTGDDPVNGNLVDFEFNGNGNIVKSTFVYDGTGSNADQRVSGVNLGEVNTGSGADQVNGTAEANVIRTNAGADNVDAGAGDDRVNSGSGADTVRGGRGADLLQGGADDDTLTGDTGDDILDGGSGRDIMTGGGAAAPTVQTITVGGLVGTGDTFRVRINTDNAGGNEVDVTVTAVAGDTQASIATKLAAAITGAAGFAGFGSAVAAGSVVTLSETDGTGFSLTLNTTDGVVDEIVIPDTATVTINAAQRYDAGDVVRVTIDATNYNFNVTTDGTTADQVAAGLAALINGGPVDMSATAAGNVISLTGINPLINFAVSATVLNVAGPAGTNVSIFDGLTGDLDASPQVGESFTLAITGFGSWTETRQAGETVTDFWYRFVNTNRGSIDAALGAGTQDINFDQSGSSELVLSGLNAAQRAATTGTFSISGPAITQNPVNTADDDGVNDNANPSVINGAPSTADDNTQSLTAALVDAGETKGADVFIVDSPDVNPFNLIGDAIDQILDFDSNDTLVFDGATIPGLTIVPPVNFTFDGVTTFGDVGTYANAFGVANAIMAGNAGIEYVTTQVGGDTFVFADLNGDNQVTQAVQLVGVVGINASQIGIDVFNQTV